MENSLKNVPKLTMMISNLMTTNLIMDNSYASHLKSILSDYLADSLSDDTLTAQDIAAAIRDGIDEWAQYHRTQLEKAEKVLTLLRSYPVHLDDSISLQGTKSLFADLETDHYMSPFVPKSAYSNDTISF